MKSGNLTDIAHAKGVSCSTVSKWKAKGLLDRYKLQDGSYNVTRAVKDIDRHLHPIQRQSVLCRWKKKQKPTEKEIRETVNMAELDFSADIHEGQRLKTIYDAALKKLDYNERRGALIDLDDVKKSFAFMGTTVKESLYGMIQRLAALLAHESDEHEVKLLMRREIDFCLNSISDIAGEAAKKGIPSNETTN